MSTNWKGILGGVAPALATALGGPAAGGAVKFLAEKLLGKPDASEAEVAAAISGATPEQIEALRKLDQDYVLALSDKVVALEKIDADDRASARGREVALHDPMVGWLAIVISAGFFSLLALLAFRSVPAENRDIIMTMVGVLGTAWIGVTTYYFGTSSGSRSKDAVIGRMAAAK